MKTIQKETYNKKKNTEKKKQNISEVWPTSSGPICI